MKKEESSLSCSQCNSELILTDTTTEKREGERTEITIMTYKCSSKTCQDSIDKATAERIKSRADRDKAREQKAAKRNI